MHTHHPAPCGVSIKIKCLFRNLFVRHDDDGDEKFILISSGKMFSFNRSFEQAIDSTLMVCALQKIKRES